MKKLLVICGPTATGKTGLGIRLAKKFNGEIVSADSRQVYRGMDIGTGKDLPVNSKFQIRNLKFEKLNLGYYLFDKIPVWMLDIVEPNEEFNVAKYYQLAWSAIEDIWRRGKLPIIVGGTGFYIKAIIDGIESLGIEPDWELREKLSNLEIEQLREKLRRLDPGRLQKMNESDRQNPRRLIRAIEIALKTQNSRLKTQNYNSKLKNRNVLFIGLKAPYKELYERIDGRVEERLRQGIEEEIRRLLGRGYTWKSSALGETIGYKEWQPFFEGRTSKEEVIERWKFDEHAYARRQLTWFKRDKRIKWFDITKPNFEDKVEKLISNWYTNFDAQKS